MVKPRFYNAGLSEAFDRLDPYLAVRREESEALENDIKALEKALNAAWLTTEISVVVLEKPRELLSWQEFPYASSHFRLCRTYKTTTGFGTNDNTRLLSEADRVTQRRVGAFLPELVQAIQAHLKESR